MKVKQSLYMPIKAPEVSSGMKFPDFVTNGTWRW